MKILVIDIETSPMDAYVWGMWDQNISLAQVKTPPRMLCFSAKWLGEKKTMFFSEWEDGADEMVYAAWALLDQADAVIHFNGRKFDIPHLNREFVIRELHPPSPFKEIDLLLAARKAFKFPSNKLDYLSQALGLGGKLHHTGFGLWKGVMDGDEKSRKTMKNYNKQDVALTEAMYNRLLGWLPNLPSRQLYDGESGCPDCGNDRLHKRGFAYTKQSKFQQYHCIGCGKYFRSTKRIDAVNLVEVVR